jgi:hypothetical protein
MSASFTNEEFRNYIRGLQFTDMAGLTGFVRPYMEELRKHQHSEPEDLHRHYIRYCLVMAEFGPALLSFTETMIEQIEEITAIQKAQSNVG